MTISLQQQADWQRKDEILRFVTGIGKGVPPWGWQNYRNWERWLKNKSPDKN